MDLLRLTVSAARAALKDKKITAVELARAHLKAIEASDLNAYLYVNAEKTLAQAAASDARLAKGEGGALEGIPLAVKDNICMKGLPMTMASRMLENFVPPYESHVTKKLWDAGAVFLGKTNLDEFAMGSGTLNSAMGKVLNPWRSTKMPEKSLVPGGSSGGSAAAVAARLAPVALGTDTGGSIRQPASFCGIVGIKPTYGRCSRRGVTPLACSFDTVGPLTRSVEDAALVLQAMAGHDEADSTSAHKEVPAFAASVGQSIKGLRVGIPAEYHPVEVDDSVRRLWDQTAVWLREAGAEVVEVNLPHIAYALQVYSILVCAEASSNLARYDGVRYGYRAEAKDLETLYTETRDHGFGEEVKRRILTGTYVLSSEGYDDYFRHAQCVRRLIFNDFNDALQKVDCLLFPASPTAAFATDDVPTDPTDMYRRDIFTVTPNLAGVPSIAVPVGLDDAGLPLGMQLVGRGFDEATLFKAAHVVEQCANFPAWEGGAT